MTDSPASIWICLAMVVWMATFSLFTLYWMTVYYLQWKMNNVKVTARSPDLAIISGMIAIAMGGVCYPLQEIYRQIGHPWPCIESSILLTIVTCFSLMAYVIRAIRAIVASSRTLRHHYAWMLKRRNYLSLYLFICLILFAVIVPGLLATADPAYYERHCYIGSKIEIWLPILTVFNGVYFYLGKRLAKVHDLLSMSAEMLTIYNALAVIMSPFTVLSILDCLEMVKLNSAFNLMGSLGFAVNVFVTFYWIVPHSQRTFMMVAPECTTETTAESGSKGVMDIYALRDDPQSWEEMKRLAERCFCLENMEFVHDVQMYRERVIHGISMQRKNSFNGNGNKGAAAAAAAAAKSMKGQQAQLTECYKLYSDIVSKYILPGSSHQVNISSACVNDILALRDIETFRVSLTSSMTERVKDAASLSSLSLSAPSSEASSSSPSPPKSRTGKKPELVIADVIESSSLYSVDGKASYNGVSCGVITKPTLQRAAGKMYEMSLPSAEEPNELLQRASSWMSCEEGGQPQTNAPADSEARAITPPPKLRKTASSWLERSEAYTVNTARRGGIYVEDGPSNVFNQAEAEIMQLIAVNLMPHFDVHANSFGEEFF